MPDNLSQSSFPEALVDHERRKTDLDIVSDTLDAEINGLQRLRSSLLDNECADFTVACDHIMACRGRVLLCGIGKSGLIARKIASTLSSTGTPSSFIHPAEAQHGDLGMIARDDVIILLSLSGESREIQVVLDFGLRMGLTLIGITRDRNSTLGKASTICLEFPHTKEACPLGLAPTTSSTIQLALGDALAMAVLNRRGFRRVDFKALHPGGALGAGLLEVSSVMRRESPLVTDDQTVAEAIYEISSKGCGIALVVDANKSLLGTISDGDLRRNMHPDLLSRRVTDIMNANPIAVERDSLCSMALQLMNDKKIMALPIISKAADGPAIVDGVVHMHDLLMLGVDWNNQKDDDI